MVIAVAVAATQRGSFEPGRSRAAVFCRWGPDPCRSRLLIASECTVEDTVDDEVNQVCVDLVIVASKPVRNANEVFDDRDDFVEGESNRAIRRRSHQMADLSTSSPQALDVFDPKCTHTTGQVDAVEFTFSHGSDEVTGSHLRFAKSI